MDQQNKANPGLPLKVGFPFDEKTNKSPENAEIFYQQAYKFCDNLYKNDTITAYNSPPSTIPEVNCCFLVRKKDNTAK